jgi:hypothetical protein
LRPGPGQRPRLSGSLVHRVDHAAAESPGEQDLVDVAGEPVHVLALASIRGLIVRGPAAGRDQAFVLARDWLGSPPPVMSREAALGELARRYLAGHAPAADRDLAQWAGIGLRDARLAGWVDDGGNLDPIPGEADASALQLPASYGLGAELMPVLGHDVALIGYSTP